MEVSNADRVVYPEDGITKGEVVAYYEAVREHMWPFLEDRALTVERFPKGTGAKGFMQKNAPSHFGDDLVSRHEVPKDDGVTNYPVAESSLAVPAFANLGVITFHVPPSTVSNPWRPDWLIWDLDPSPGEIGMVRESASVLHELLKDFGVSTVLMSSGSNGYHLRTRVTGVDAQEAASVARGLAALAAAAYPELMTLEFRKVERKGRVFVDWLRNAPYSTSVVPWSLRPRQSAPVAVPLHWAELESVDPDGCEFRAALTRLEDDPWAGHGVVDLAPLVDQVSDAVSDAGIALEPFDRFRS